MSLLLTTESKEQIICCNHLPEPFAQLSISDAEVYAASGDYGTLIFQEIPGEHFSIWYSAYIMQQTTCLYGSGDIQSLELHFTLLDEQVCLLDGLGKVVVPAWRYNLTYLPFIDNRASFREGSICTSFDIHFSMDYLLGLLPFMPALGPFLEQADKGIACSLHPEAAVASSRMIAIINKILYSDYTGIMKRVYLENKVQELLTLALERITFEAFIPAGLNLHPGDIERLQEARDWLLKNMDDPCTLRELAQKVFMNEFKLKKGFRQLFGTSVFDFLLEARMEKAYQLLFSTDTPVREIAMMTGYKSIPAFTAAFRSRYGEPPGILRVKRVRRW
ncbi:helix-turn-helix transcriptional regulator [Chitinophaga solisilvae]|uniref:helix-turn-helix transcriptional regulator n=1 Tax=Chitinophaga solisilvae TaxID=1233460 RepID=UPI00136DBAA8|nr:AraC family transcriptional regulator [Chitinophaga solisilvae]